MRVKIRDLAEKKKDSGLFLGYLKIMENSFVFVAQSDPEHNFCLLRWLEAKTQ